MTTNPAPAPLTMADLVKALEPFQAELARLNKRCRCGSMRWVKVGGWHPNAIENDDTEAFLQCEDCDEAVSLGIERPSKEPPPMTDAERIEAAIELAVRYGGIDGAHHKTWVIDQMVRVLAGDRYGQIVTDARAGEDGPNTYEWDEGIAP